MPMTQAALATEINTDPTGLGYATLKLQTNGPEAVAQKLNEIHASHTLFKAYVPVEDLLAEIVFSEYTAWTTGQKTNIDQFFRGTRIKTGSANMRTTLAAVIPVGASRTAMIAAAARPCSRAEFLWGEGTFVTDHDVALVINP